MSTDQQTAVRDLATSDLEIDPLQDGRIVEEDRPEVFFSAPTHERSRLFIAKILNA